MRVFKISNAPKKFHQIWVEKTINLYLKANNSLYTTRIFSFKYVFIAFFEKKVDAKIYNYVNYFEYELQLPIINNLYEEI